MSSKIRRLLPPILSALSLLAWGCGSGGGQGPSTVTSDQGLFRITATSDLRPLAINEIHTWTVHVETSDGREVDDAQISVDGGMPEHQHGLPTVPRVARSLGNGSYVVEGMKFSMPGHWEVKVAVTAGGESDVATFDLELE